MYILVAKGVFMSKCETMWRDSRACVLASSFRGSSPVEGKIVQGTRVFLRRSPRLLLSCSCFVGDAAHCGWNYRHKPQRFTASDHTADTPACRNTNGCNPSHGSGCHPVPAAARCSDGRSSPSQGCSGLDAGILLQLLERLAGLRRFLRLGLDVKVALEVRQLRLLRPLGELLAPR